MTKLRDWLAIWSERFRLQTRCLVGGNKGEPVANALCDLYLPH